MQNNKPFLTTAPPSSFAARTQGIGGGAPATPLALDPNGLVPINRTQPRANDQFQAQRLMENRLGTMPPSSFSGSGAGFVPVNRPMPAAPIVRRPMPMMAPAAQPSAAQPAAPAIAASPVFRTDMARREMATTPRPAVAVERRIGPAEAALAQIQAQRGLLGRA